MDPTAIVPESARTFEYGPITKIWGWGNAACGALGTPAIIFIVIHSNRILKSAATSQRAIAMHKEAIRSLVIQVLAMLTAASIPVFIFGFCLTWHMIGHLPSSMYILADFGAGLFSMESFFGSIAILTTITVYRVHLIRKVDRWKPMETRVVSLVSDSQATSTLPN